MSAGSHPVPIVRLRWLCEIVITLPVLASLGVGATDKRIALVIGNAAYQHVTPLANHKNDAKAMADKLEFLGFDAIEAIDL
jgi:hypothetical protein